MFKNCAWLTGVFLFVTILEFLVSAAKKLPGDKPWLSLGSGMTFLKPKCMGDSLAFFSDSCTGDNDLTNYSTVRTGDFTGLVVGSGEVVIGSGDFG